MSCKLKKFGSVALIGPANAGKSTLLNAILGDKVSIVTDKPHTTRKQILGIKTTEQGQIVFVDTPGFTHAIKRGKLKDVLSQSLKNSMRACELVTLVLDSSKIKDSHSLEIILGASKKFVLNVPKLVLLNKIDLKPHHEVLPIIQIVSKFFETINQEQPPEIIPISGLKKRNLQHLLEVIFEHLPQGEMVFDAQTLTDQTDEFFIAELVREKVFKKMREEIPYSVAVRVDKIIQTKKLLTTFVEIIVEREGQKRIIIGNAGQNLKAIGTEARLELEQIYGIQVNLQLMVKVEADWSVTEKGIKKVL
ncbi:MAG: GTPase Era [Deltaproteobacteria bacterium]|jgi:GTP-binding protein Era|nr:GTPase Era [Deltaproteobacteria bacterium]